MEEATTTFLGAQNIMGNMEFVNSKNLDLAKFLDEISENFEDETFSLSHQLQERSFFF